MDNVFTCIIIDDEEPAIGLLIENLKILYNNLSILGTYTNWSEGFIAIRTASPDIVFLDIALNEKNSIDLLKMIPTLESEIIFITAHSEYAIDAFKFSTSGYIVKPIGPEELVYAVDKALERANTKRTAKKQFTSVGVRVPKIGIPNNSGVEYVNVNDILYFEATERYTKVILKNSEILTSFSIGKYKYVLKEYQFFQVHRSYIVNLNAIVRYNIVGDIVMLNNKHIPVSKNVREEFLQLFNTVTSKPSDPE